MREEIDYEATKAALRAQVSATPSAHHAASAGWRWFSAVAGVVVVVCAVTVTLWATHGGSEAQMRLVPSAGHETGHSGFATTSAAEGDPAPAAVGAPTQAATSPIDRTPASTADEVTADDVAAAAPGDDVAGVGPIAPGPTAAPRTDAAAIGTPSPPRGGGDPPRAAAGPLAPSKPVPSSVPPPVTPPVTAPPGTAPPNTEPAPPSGGGASDPGGSGGGGGQSSDGTDSVGTSD